MILDLENINLGTTAGDKTGDGARTGGGKINRNFEKIKTFLETPDAILVQTGYALVGQNLTFNSGWKWRIATVEYTNPSDVVINFPLAASGKSRLDVVVLTTSNTFLRVAGAESTSTPVAPSAPSGSLYVTVVLVTDGAVNEPEQPEVNGAYVQKSERANVVLTGSGVINQLDLVDEKATIVFKGSVTRLNTISYASVPYNGKRITLFNAQATPVTIGHSVSGFGVDFVFPNGQDYVLEPNQTIEFSFDITYFPFAHHMLIGAAQNGGGATFKPFRATYTGGPQEFTLPGGISQVLLVFVNGQMWDDLVQFTYDTTTVTVIDTLQPGWVISIIYAEAPVSALPFYTRAEENALFETKKPRLVYVNTKQDFIDHGSKTGNVITLDENVNFHLINNIDLSGDRLVCSYNTIFDHLATNASLKSTGLGDEYIITVNNTCRFDNFLLEGNSVNDGIYVNNLTATIVINQLVMQNFKFGLEVINANNVLIDKSNFVNSNVKVFNSVGYFGMNESILLSTVSSVGSLLEFKNTAVLVDRTVLYRNSFVNSAGVTGLILDNAITCGAEKLQLIYNRFSGVGANKITGINSIDTRADFKNNEGIKNGAIIGNYYNISNATATDIVTTNVPVKVNSTATTADPITNKFTHTNNRLTYIGSFEKDFVLNATASVTGTNGHNLAFQFAKNGTVIASTYQPISIGATNRAENVKVIGAVSLAPNDYIELWVRNVNNNNDVIVTSYSVLIEAKN